jgi:NAD+ synthase (glutamine-hydrolysing)
MQMGFVRVAAMTLDLRLADTEWNASVIVEALEAAAADGVQVAICPELCLTGYTCADLFYQEQLQRDALAALARLATALTGSGIAAVVGLPVAFEGRLYNCAALLAGGGVRGIVPKSYLPNAREYYEQRWFASGRQLRGRAVEIGGRRIPFGVDLLFRATNLPACVLGIEICEDLWTVQPPSGALALAGATLLANPSASDELLGKVEYRRELVRQQSGRCLAAYLYAGAGPGESTTDLVFGGHCLVAENGAMLAQTERFRFETRMAVADVDVHRLTNERIGNSSFASDAIPDGYRDVPFALADGEPQERGDLRREVARLPFVPYETARRARHCEEIVAIQATGLARRLRHTGLRTVTIGVSGGLDSTLALLVTVRAFDALGLPRAGILGVTMPGFGTTERTSANAVRLIDLLGVATRRIPIDAAVRQHFRDIGHDESVHDVTYENAQARERTQILMDLANQTGGLVVGTGDLSELALGWCTYNGDQMSMYHVNAGVPKTLVRSLVEWCAEELFSGETSAVLRDICAMPITPELLPPGAAGGVSQKTEEIIGPFVLHDFFLFHAVRHQCPPAKIRYLAERAFAGEFTAGDIRRHLDGFYRRFFSQQFKRSAMPDGPKVGTLALSPRGDWRMPSDGSPDAWLR